MQRSNEFIRHFYSFISSYIYIYSSFNKIILKFYQQQSSKKFFVVNCLPALPLLHFLREESKPFEDVICEKPVDVTSLKWWGLQELPYKDIRRQTTARFVYVCLLI
jgi:hypothetical protein